MKSDRHIELAREDARARVVAQREFGCPLVLEAGAGTGKTATLVARIVSWCLGPGWESAERQLPETTLERVAARVLARVVAITFTEAAAAEMAERVERVLGDIASGEMPETLTEISDMDAGVRRLRAEALCAAIDQLPVQTIHAWCRAILAAHPIEAGLHPRFAVDADLLRHRALVRDVLDAELRRAYAAPIDARHLTLAEHGVGPGELEEALVGLVEAGVAAREFAQDPLAAWRIAELLEDLRDGVHALLEASAGTLHACGPVRIAREVAAALDATASRLAAAPAKPAFLAELCAWLGESWQENLTDRLLDWGRDRFKAGERDALGDRSHAVATAAARLAPALVALRGLDPLLLAQEHGLLATLLARVEQAARAQGLITFQGLLESCARLLVECPPVAAALRREIDQLLVDEFQDTDARQCSLIASLALEGPPAARPGLFLVGDPKQSIYGWRSADLAAYEGFLERVEAAGGAVHRLSVNHRSVPAVLEEVERVLAPVMQRRAQLQPGFETLVASDANANRAGFEAGTAAPIEHWLPVSLDDAQEKPLRTRLADATRHEARALAADLRQLHDVSGVLWSSVGVLFRSRGDWDVYLTALREADVPFAVEGDRSYFQRREIIDASALVRSVLDPADPLALLAMLRCSAVGVPDAALEPLFERDFVALAARLPDRDALRALTKAVDLVVAELPAHLPGLERIRGWEHNLLDWLDAVGALRTSFLVDPADVFVEKLRQRTLFEVAEAARFLGAWRAANLERFFSDLAGGLAAGAPVGDVLRGLRHAVAEEEPREEGRLRDLLPDAVRILTLHGAKGLAFDHVYLMQLHKGGGRREDGVAARRVAGSRGDRLELRLQGTETLGWHRARMQQEQVAAFERVRLLYVAMTRARQRLVLSGLPRGFFQGDDSLAALVARREPAGPDVAELVGRCTASESHRVDTAAARWALPALAPEARGHRAEAVPREVPDVERVRRDAETLRVAAHEASLRMQRPFGCTASAAAHARDAGGSPASGVTLGGDPEVARAAGSAIHHVLEVLDLGVSPERSLAEAPAAIDRYLAAHVRATVHGEAQRAAHALLDGMATGDLLPRLFALGPRRVARELPLLLRPGPDDVAVGFVSGSIDLLYRDPGAGALVVVDYKTDRLGDDAALQARAAHYAPQGEVYVRAVQEAFGLDARPRFELWFLAHDRCIAVAPRPSHALQLHLELGPAPS